MVKCTLVYWIILLIVMQGYFTKKNEKNPNLDLLSIPRLWGGKTNTKYTGSLGYNSVFRVCYITSIDVDVILDTCSTIEIMICYHSSTYQNAPGPSGHTNVKVGSEAAINYRTSSWRWVNSIYYSDLNRHVSTQEKQNQRQYITPSSIVVLYRWPDNNILPHVMPLGNFIL